MNSRIVNAVFGAGLRVAAYILPAHARPEWIREWKAELFHVCASSEKAVATCWGSAFRFCAGAIPDALCMRRLTPALMRERQPWVVSAGACLRALTFLLAAAISLALALPNVRANLKPRAHGDSHGVVLVESSFSDKSPSVKLSGAQYLVWKLKQQRLFQQFAYYTVRTQRMLRNGVPQPVRVASASESLFPLLLYSQAPRPGSEPQVVLSDGLWRRKFGANSEVVGTSVQIGGRMMQVAGVAEPEASLLPGHADVWTAVTDDAIRNEPFGYLLARLPRGARGEVTMSQWQMSAPRPDSTIGAFSCTALDSVMPHPESLFLFAALLACLALPATTSLPLGEYQRSAHKPCRRTIAQRWAFLAAKAMLALMAVFFFSVDLAYVIPSNNPYTAAYLQLASAFALCLAAFRWVLRDQRKRCPVCLGKLTQPARVGEPSRNFLAWNGTELICAGGHGLLHVPEMETSWFRRQRWLYLDPSWSVLFSK